MLLPSRDPKPRLHGPPRARPSLATLTEDRGQTRTIAAIAFGVAGIVQAEFRPEDSVRKLTGLARYPDVILKRGIIGSLDLYAWLDDIRNGNQMAYRTVTVRLMNEDHTTVVQEWKLLRARIIKHVSGPFNARASDVAMEELTLAYERLDME